MLHILWWQSARVWRIGAWPCGYKPYNVDDTVLMLMDRIRSDDMNEELLGQNALGHRHCEDCELLIFLLEQYVLGQWCAELLILFLTECFVQGVIHSPDETILTAVNEQWWVYYWLVDTSYESDLWQLMRWRMMSRPMTSISDDEQMNKMVDKQVLMNSVTSPCLRPTRRTRSPCH